MRGFEEYIDLHPGIADARLREGGASVWAIIAYLQGDAQGDALRAAKDFEVGYESILAAQQFYEAHQAVIDARLAANAA